MSGTGFVDQVTGNVKKARDKGKEKVNNRLIKGAMPELGSNMYLQSNSAGLSRGVNTLSTSGLSNMEKGRVGGLAALDYFTGMDTSRVTGRANARMGPASSLAASMEGADEAGRTARRSALGAASESTNGLRMRGARAGVRMGALGAGMAALDFLNPFSPGFND
jgi:hypothetical protein